jgi:hypothetical protein
MGLLFFGVVIVLFLTFFSLIFRSGVKLELDSTTDIYCYQMFLL